jgi:hypothetical protein
VQIQTVDFLKAIVLRLMEDEEIQSRVNAFLQSSYLNAHKIITEMEKDKKLLSVAETANYFGKSKVWVHGMTKNGILVKHKIKGNTYFKISEMEAALIEIKKFKTNRI